jgi:predicted kinase
VAVVEHPGPGGRPDNQGQESGGSVRALAAADPILRIPGRALVILIGAAGAGKTTLAARHFPAEAVLSSDAFRARLGSGEGDQTVTAAAFAALHRAVEARLAARRLVVVDATNVTRAARVALISRARISGAPVFGIVLDLPPATVLRRGAGRVEGPTNADAVGATTFPGRDVPVAVVRRHLDAVAATDDEQLLAEGFEVVRRLRSPAEVESLRILQGP